MRPAYGSASVLKTNATMSSSGSGSRSVSSARCIAGEGRSSTKASSSRLVARFFVATPQVIGNRFPSFTPFFSAVTISSWEMSTPSR
jgi:hypothetical protein